MASEALRCPVCNAPSLKPFYDVARVPVHDVQLMPTRAAAVEVERGDIRLGVCATCGFVSNVLFNEALLAYGDGYEATQAFSPTFGDFHRRLAEDLVARHDLYQKHILEIGCGNGEFLALLCELGENEGVGYDPALDEHRASIPSAGHIRYVKDFFTASCQNEVADFVCCKMTLEHAHDPGRFVGMVRAALGERSPHVFFQVPNAEKIFQDRAFWDIYYEHPSYFSPDSLRYTFQRQGFVVDRTWTEYGGQYLMIEAHPAPNANPVSASGPSSANSRMVELANTFSREVHATIEAWRAVLREQSAAGNPTVLWGAGSKAVSFLSALQDNDAIDFCIDVNPYKAGTFLPGSGHPIYHPDALPSPPGLVIVMNPVYRREIEDDLRKHGYEADVLDLDFDPCSAGVAQDAKYRAEMHR